jgi:hypothetical protein
MNPISLVISDVGGTLVTPDKRLTDANASARRWGGRLLFTVKPISRCQGRRLEHDLCASPNAKRRCGGVTNDGAKPCSFARPNSTAKKTLAVHAAELAVKSCLQIPRRHCRSLLLGLSSSSIGRVKSCPSPVAIGQPHVTQSEDWYKNKRSLFLGWTRPPPSAAKRADVEAPRLDWALDTHR